MISFPFPHDSDDTQLRPLVLRFWVLLKTTFGPDNPKHEGNQAVYQIDLRRYVTGTESFAETEPMHQLREGRVNVEPDASRKTLC